MAIHGDESTEDYPLNLQLLLYRVTFSIFYLSRV